MFSNGDSHSHMPVCILSQTLFIFHSSIPIIFVVDSLVWDSRTKGITYIDSIIPSILEIAITRLQTATKDDLKVVLLEIVRKFRERKNLKRE
jgi:hypothetical protein